MEYLKGTERGTEARVGRSKRREVKDEDSGTDKEES